jgi:hypothetical protein
MTIGYDLPKMKLWDMILSVQRKIIKTDFAKEGNGSQSSTAEYHGF